MAESKQWLPQRLDPAQSIPQTEVTVGDFWSWAFSDILENDVRGVFAEFLVGSALGCISSETRQNWDRFDLLYNGKKIEVKSSGFVQSWQQERKSAITFDIAPRTGWDAVTNVYDDTVMRHADCYVFCLFAFNDIHDKAGATQQITDTDSWHFCVIATTHINRVFDTQKTVSMGRLHSEGFAWVSFANLRNTVDKALESDR